MKFGELGLDKSLLKAVQRSGFEEATPIQAETIPLVLAGHDVIGQAQTGTGKTAAFGLPVLQHLDLELRQIQAVIISPTRELAIQTQEELFGLGKEKRAKVQVVYGGADINRQIRQLKHNTPQVLVGTPGRLLDHIKRGTVDFSNVKNLILDEADEMLDMGFLDDIESIIAATPSQRQTLLFSATMPKEILRIGEKFMTEPKIVKIKAKELTTDLVDQYFIKTRDNEKFDIMTRLIDVQTPDLTIVFGRTKRRVDELSRGLEARGYNAAGIHGDLTQQRRMNVLKKFKNGDLDILVATDVAARGLDISGVTHVYNYDIPQDPESYVHRIGRTGRAGNHGTSVTFVTPFEMDYLRVIEKLTKKRMEPLKPPTEEQAFHGQVASALDDIKDLIDDTDTKKYEAQAQDLLEKYDAIDVVAAFLNNMTRKDAYDVPVKITPERPLPRRKKGNNRRGGNRKFNHRNDRYNRRDRRDNGRSFKKNNKFKSNKQKNRFTIRTKD
ncbi:DEAD-box ATP-dependent RNA helicase CshA [Ligilactobacillus hayakitensis DSM 18933 = JCM 14209]|uniref:DEAD-box ATP-dependent RNA helicase CshA n=1 Tax=Ligilactobacillus hayakitensis DSM 18933 = JCM 14209 TaxID=1423755 RepID=A0A0R1WK06_9LACO|nr:DEAD/DEAH box helicase [Ligilactobacillus hayakitensis]KRM17901.1 DEAD-box ATP-dependent RNA helicase CshA [Ligilactobacillus hayakitensis DSM 18933 = JCM 14209]